MRLVWAPVWAAAGGSRVAFLSARHLSQDARHRPLASAATQSARPAGLQASGRRPCGDRPHAIVTPHVPTGSSSGGTTP